jgi:tripartite-type tricarboxylate transporter receptor subunit TctC
MPDRQVNAWMALLAPRDTPQAVVRKLNAAVGQAFAEHAVMKRLSALGVETPPPEQRSPDALSDLINSEFDKWLPLIRSAENSAKP